jgi:hypothetical protein
VTPLATVRISVVTRPSTKKSLRTQLATGKFLVATTLASGKISVATTLATREPQLYAKQKILPK